MLKTFSVLTEMNIVLDPSVSGSVTVELRDVPWDQALDLILKINGLDYVLENNVLRVAPISKLASEEKREGGVRDGAGEGQTAQDDAETDLLLEGERHRRCCRATATCCRPAAR